MTQDKETQTTETLSEEHIRWVEAIQKENPHFPVGFARAMVELYLKDPAYFKRDNLEAMSKNGCNRDELLQKIVGEGVSTEKGSGSMQILPKQEDADEVPINAEIIPAEPHNVVPSNLPGGREGLGCDCQDDAGAGVSTGGAVGRNESQPDIPPPVQHPE